MPNTIGYSFGDVILVPFPFTDQSTTKKRPAIVVSSDAYHGSRPDLILVAVTSQVRPVSDIGEAAISEWREAGLLKPSVVKPLLATVAKSIALRKLGRLSPADLAATREVLRIILGT